MKYLSYAIVLRDLAIRIVTSSSFTTREGNGECFTNFDQLSPTMVKGGEHVVKIFANSSNAKLCGISCAATSCYPLQTQRHLDLSWNLSSLSLFPARAMLSSHQPHSWRPKERKSASEKRLMVCFLWLDCVVKVSLVIVQLAILVLVANCHHDWWKFTNFHHFPPRRD